MCEICHPVAAVAAPFYYQSDEFSLTLSLGNNRSTLVMQIHGKNVHTGSYPNTSVILKKLLPGVLKTTCFNDDHLPFYLEVKRTELAHLFEHILLQYLCLEKKRLHAITDISYTGRTAWNWDKEPFGLFHIHVDIGNKDERILMEALRKSIVLFTTIIDRSKTISSAYGQPVSGYPQRLPNS